MGMCEVGLRSCETEATLSLLIVPGQGFFFFLGQNWLSKLNWGRIKRMKKLSMDINSYSNQQRSKGKHVPFAYEWAK